MTFISPIGRRGFPGQQPTLKELNLICWSLLFVGFVLPFSIVVLSSHSPPSGDFAGFYSLGRILNEHPVNDLYNYELLKQVCQQVHPRNLAYGPLPYPPFVGLFFRPFALLPFWLAYLLWSLLSIALYASGVIIALNRFFPLESLRRSMALCFACSYCPFLVDTAANGQLAAVGFFALAWAVKEDSLEHQFRSGLALSVCIYKPTLVVLLLPMILVTRRWKTLFGFSTGAIAVGSITTAVEGFSAWRGFLAMILSFGKASVAVKSQSLLVLVKYVDFTSFSHLVHGGRSWLGLTILFAVTCWALISLARAWWRSPQMGKPFQSLVWAATLTWTLLLNVYVPIYDSVLIVLAVILTAGSLRHVPRGRIHGWFTMSWVLILAGSWFTVLLAGKTGVQLLTLLLICFGALQFAGLRMLTQQDGDTA